MNSVAVSSARRIPKLALIGVVLAIAITTVMDVSGLVSFSALPLFPLLAIFWFLERLPRRSVGFVWGHWRDYVLAVAYPLLVIGSIVIVVTAVGALDLSQTDWSKTWRNLGLLAVSTFLVAMITEEGFFRGWLWASLERAGHSPARILIFTSVAFSLWHLSAVALPTGYNPPAAQVPVFMVNAAVIGAIWALMRLISGSVVVTSLSHGVWNALAYVLFGFGEKVGALGVANTALYGPEIGVLGLALNVAFAAALWRWWKSHRAAPPD